MTGLGLGTLVRCLLGQPAPAAESAPSPDGSPKPTHAQVEAETVQRLREGLHGRRADRQIEAASREAAGLRARMAALRAHGELDARGGGGA